MATTTPFVILEATFKAAAKAAPLDIPAKIPDSFASRRAAANASSVDTVQCSSTSLGS
jgi:hypothetical protein